MINKTNKYILALLTMASLYSCSKPDNNSSLLEPAFKRCHMSKEYVNNQLFREVIYQDGGKYQVDHILYYQNNVVRDDWTEYFEYDNGRIASVSDQYNSYSYDYNDKGKLISITSCDKQSNSCCTSTYKYDQTNTLPLEVVTACTDGSFSTETFDYTNYSNRSYYYLYSDQNQSTVQLYQKFTQGYINPLGEIYPNGIDYYQDRIIEDYKEKKYKEFIIDSKELKGRYPIRLTLETYSMPEFNLLSSEVYTYEYVGCD